jgi:ApaG protein
VVGEQPVLKPGSSFQYESACPLRTPTGKMEGAYQMVGCLRVRGGRCA